MPDPFQNATGIISRVRLTLLAGAAAGDLTLTGIDATEDKILSVQTFTFTLTEGAPNVIDAIAVEDLTSEFTITAADTINNAAGTSTAGRLVIVQWYDADWGETAAIP